MARQAHKSSASSRGAEAASDASSLLDQRRDAGIRRTVELRIVVDGAHDLGKGLAVRILEDLPDQRQDERRHDDWDCGISGLDRQSDEQYDM